MPISTLLRRHRLALVAGTAAVLVAGGGATAAVASTAAGSAPTASPSSTCAPGVGRLLQALPDSLGADLKHLRHDTAANKAADRAAIKKNALAGEYGVRYEQVARIASGTGGKAAAALPAALKADLKTLRGDAKGSDARKAEAAEIWQKAVAGDYGTRIETLAKDAKAKIAERCAAKAGSGTAAG